MNEHDRLRDLLGVYVLGGLSAAERAEVDDHLSGCARCRDDLVELAPIPGLLSQVRLGDLEASPPPDPDVVVAGARADLDRLRASRARWRRAAGIAAAVALVAVGASLVLEPGRSDPAERETVALVLDAGPTVGGSISVEERAWGSYVHVSLEGLPARDRYHIWAVDTSGTWHESGSWRPTADDTARLGASTHLRLDEVDQVVVTADDRTDTILRAVPR
jgi:hypothetical protein